MIGGKKVLAIVPARGGSKGVPRKNLRILGGSPLIAWTIAAAKAATTLDRIILSSDDPEIMSAAREAGCEVPFSRPAALATDDASMLGVVHHAVSQCGKGFDWVVLLQATSPLRLGKDIDAAVTACHNANAPACVTVTAAQKTPYWMFYREPDGRMRPVIETAAPSADRRQKLPEAFVLNGSVYVARLDWLLGRSTFLSKETICHVMPWERSIDIDSETDLIIANAIFAAEKQ